MISARNASFLASLLILAACGKELTYKSFRPVNPSDAQFCADALSLGPTNKEISKTEPRYECALQLHKLPKSPGGALTVENTLAATKEKIPNSGNQWNDFARHHGVDLRNEDEFHLAFLELNEDGELLNSFQKNVLNQHLKRVRSEAGAQNIVVAYVHGWRHDAAVRDGDVLKLRRVLGQTRAALNTRCLVQGKYCNATVTGVFLAWPGRKIDEGPSDIAPDLPSSGGIASVPAIDTFGDRFDVSNKIAPKLWEQLSWLNRSLARNYSRSDADKLLVVGHSMGGNILAKTMVKKVSKQISGHNRRRAVEPVIGDLVVLLNPASDAVNWTAFQELERKRAGLQNSRMLTCRDIKVPGEPTRYSGCSASDQANMMKWQKLYPDTQRPTYISLTSVNDWGRVKDKKRKIDYDKATGTFFPIGRWFYSDQDPVFETAIGHADPEYANATTLTSDSKAEGTTHEITILSGPRTGIPSTRYSRPMSVKAGWCAPGDGWLLHARHAREREHGPWEAKHNERWEYGWVHPDFREDIAPNIGGLQNKARAKWAQMINLKSGEDRLSVAPRNTPFWNVRAHDSAIKNHAGWASANTWCAINQLVLDDVTAKELYLPEGKTVKSWIDHNDRNANRK